MYVLLVYPSEIDQQNVHFNAIRSPTQFPPEIRDVLTYRALNDPHYWLGEIYCRLHPEWFVALPFTAGSTELPSLGLRRFRRPGRRQAR